jgi:YebC/PmpR family DNA-binding regulatory protein
VIGPAHPSSGVSSPPPPEPKAGAEPGPKAQSQRGRIAVRFPIFRVSLSGHSKWHTIKHKKGAADAKRGKAFTRIIKELTVAARNGGGDPRQGEQHAAREHRAAIRRGTGEEPGVSYEEITYEGYGPGGVALLIQSLTDNKNRTVGEIRHMLSKYNGNLAAENSVAWMFHRKGQVVVEKDKTDEEKLLNVALEAGADDVNDDGGAWEIVCPPESFEVVRDAESAVSRRRDRDGSENYQLRARKRSRC